MDRSNPYEAAFEAYLQAHRLAYVAVDETRRTPVIDDPLKTLDFLVFAPAARLCIDIKGRRFPGGTPDHPRRVWECWSFREDIDGLERWARMAGDDYRPLLVFAYLLDASVAMPENTPDLFAFRDERYLFRAIDVEDYRQHMRVRSPRWGTVSLPTARYRAHVRPFRHFTRSIYAEAPF
jgi:hypothetical protein